MHRQSKSCPHNLFQCLITLTVKKLFLMFKVDFPVIQLALLPLVPSLVTTGRSLAPFSLHPLVYTH